MSELLLIRHAQASFGTDNYDHLSATGFQQAEALGDYFAERAMAVDKIFTGTHERHRQTLDAILRRNPQDVEINKMPALNEYRFSELYQAYARRYPEDEDIISNTKAGTKNASLFYRVIRKSLLAWQAGELNNNVTEAWDAFEERTVSGLRSICNKQDKGITTLVVTSGGVISMFLFKILNVSYEQAVDFNMQIQNCSITRCYYSGDKIQVASFNGLPHLDTRQNRQLITLS